MRRGSLVTPLLLIGIGALFLARNVMPDLPLLDYLAMYWPFLLILWGGLRLLEIAVWSVRGRPLPAYGISGGEWVLVVMLCLFGMGLHAARGFTSWLPQASIDWGGLEVFGESVDRPVTAESETGAAPRIVVENFRGTARIVGGDGNTVKVSGYQSVRSMDVAAEPEFPVEVIRDGEQVTIRVHQEQVYGAVARRGSGRRRILANLDITVPRGAGIVAAQRDGDLHINGITGAVEVTGTNSSARLEDIGGVVRLDMTGASVVRAVNLKNELELKGRGNDIDLEKIAGQVTISGSWGGLAQFRELAKPVRWSGLRTNFSAEAVPGELRMTIGDISGSRIRGPLRIESQSKDLHLTDVTGATSISLDRGDVRLNAPSGLTGDVSINVKSGDVEVTLPENARFRVQAETGSGEAHSDFGGEAEDGRRGARIAKDTGGPQINVRVSRGDIALRRWGSLAAEPARLPSTSLPKAVQQ